MKIQLLYSLVNDYMLVSKKTTDTKDMNTSASNQGQVHGHP